MARNDGIALIFFTALVLLMTQLAHPVPRGMLLTDRAVETLIGAAVGILVFALHHAAVTSARKRSRRRPPPRADPPPMRKS